MHSFSSMHALAVILALVAGRVLGSPDTSPPPRSIDFWRDDVGPRWQEVTSAADAFSHYPGKIRFLLGALDTGRPGLEKMRHALSLADTVAVLEEILRDYEKRNTADWLETEREEVTEAEILTIAKMLTRDSVSFHGIATSIALLGDAGWDWRHTGPHNDQEFGYSLNGHQYLNALLQAWKQTTDTVYVKTFDRIIRDWIIHNPLPPKGDKIYSVLSSSPDNKLDYRDIGEVRWRTLETGNRLGVSWPRLFYGFRESPAFTPAARLLMLASMAEQAGYLRRYHRRRHNWTTMEMNGLLLTGLTFPEFKDAEQWVTYALNVMLEEIDNQVYPDGVQKELSTKTQWVALRRFESVADYLRQAGREVPPHYTDRLEDMYNYLAYAMRPDGHQPLNNDSDREDLRPRVLKAAHTFNRPDWEWIATNGDAGVCPETLPSAVFPWAGIHVMRNGWGRRAHWAFFDTGPFGTGHQHADKLHLSIAAFGRDLLVDAGRYTHEDYFSFDPKVWRGYFRSSNSHNVILVDGSGQNGGPLVVDSPLVSGNDYLRTDAFDFARATFDGGYRGVSGKATHSRAVLYLRDRCWVVVDRIVTDRPRNIEALWHFAPACTVQTEDGTVASTDPGEGNLRIVPAGKIAWTVNLTRGQREPELQGWYSSDYGTVEENSTAVFSATIRDSAIFAWVLVPAVGAVPDVETKLTTRKGQDVLMRVTIAGEKPFTVQIPLGDGQPCVK